MALANVTILALAIGAGALAMFVLWVSTRSANRETRAQWIAIEAISSLLLIFVVFFARTSVTPEARAPEWQTAIESPPHAGHPPIAPPAGEDAFSHASGDHHIAVSSSARPVWFLIPLVLAAVVTLFLTASWQRSLVAGLAVLAIVGGLLVSYFSLADRPEEPAQVEYRSIAEAPMSPMPLVKPVDDASAQAVDADEKQDAASGTATVAEKPATPPPPWVNARPEMSDGVYRAAVVVGPYATEDECEQRLPNAVQHSIVMRYADRYLTPSARDWAAYNAASLANDLVTDRYFETIQASFGPMLKLHARVEISQSSAARIEHLAMELEKQKAVQMASIGGICVWGALVLLYGGLRFGGRKNQPSAAELPPSTPGVITP
jgi:hypothetical protein